MDATGPVRDLGGVWDEGAERATLGAMLLSSSAIEEITKILEPRDFYNPRHEEIYQTIIAQYTTNKPVDAVTIASRLGKDLHRVGGAPYLHQCMDSVPTAANGSYYANIVAELAVKRRLAAAGAKIMQMGSTVDPGDLGLILTKAFEELRGVPGRPLDAPEDVGDTVDFLLESMENPTEEATFHTGISALDTVYRGAAPGRFDVFAGRPAQGKSVMAINFIRENAIRRGIRVVLFSLEMGAQENMARVLSAEAKVNLHRIVDPLVHPTEESDWVKIHTAYPRVRGANLVIYDKPMNLTQMAAVVREEKRTHSEILVIVDYLQLMPTVGKPENRQVEVGRNADGFKIMARELDVAVVALAQLNRKSADRDGGVPRMSDLRESGSIEQSADVVVLIHRPDQESCEHPRAGEADLIVAKQRNGSTGTATCVFQGHYARFIDFSG